MLIEIDVSIYKGECAFVVIVRGYTCFSKEKKRLWHQSAQPGEKKDDQNISIDN